MTELIVVALISLATYRVTRLVVSDYITEPLREWLARRIAHRQRLIYLLSCEWCVSIWIGGAATLAADVFTSVPLPVMTWLTASAVTGFLSGHEGGEDDGSGAE